jgi:GAF domain-containing protein
MSPAVPPALDVSRFLKAIDRGTPIHDVLDDLVRAVEAPGHDGARNDVMLGSILLLEGRRLRHGAAPSLPASYNMAIDGIEIGPAVGSCGTAAHCGHAIFVVDTATDPLWRPFKTLALRHGLRACWSSPILGSSGQVLGTFALYYRNERSPTSDERLAIAGAAEAARTIIEHAAARVEARSQQARSIESELDGEAAPLPAA